MPCACRVPWETYPEATVWGPLVWKALHGAAERVGSTSFALYQSDERRLWISLLKALGKMIPCPTCKEHYAAYTKENPFEEQMKTLPYYDLNNWIRTYLWDLHNWVNQSNKKDEFPFEELSILYNKTNLRETLKELRKPIELAIQLSGNQILAFQEFSKHYTMLLSLYGV
jgi:hypothetical protein